MKILNEYQLQCVNGGLDSSQFSYVVVMATQAIAAIGLHLIGKASGVPMGGSFFKYAVSPLCSIGATIVGYELHNQVLEPRYFKNPENKDSIG